MSRTNWRIVLALAVCAALLSTTASAKDQVTRSILHLQGNVTLVVDLSDWSFEAEDWGNASHGGRFTNQGWGYMLPGGYLVGEGILTAANGDQLFWTMRGPTCTFTGGTGRFEGATGGFIFVFGPPEITFEDGLMIVKFSYMGAEGTITY